MEEDELAAKMEKADMSAVVLSDDEDNDLGWHGNSVRSLHLL